MTYANAKWEWIAALMVACAATTACGKKGPPLTPFVRVPATVEMVAARRAGSDVFVTLTIPKENLDRSTPASIARVDLYGATSMTPPPRARFLEIATLVATVPVAPAADPEDPLAPVPVSTGEPGAAQGSEVTVRDALTPDEMNARQLPVLRREADRPPVAPPLAGAAPRTPFLRRFYMAIPVNDGGRPGPPSTIVELGLAATPPPPAAIRAAMTTSAITIQWEPSGGILAWLLDRALPLEEPPLPELATAPATAAAARAVPDVAVGPTTYNVYRQMAADPLVLPDTQAERLAWNTPPPTPLNPAPLAVLTFTDPIVLDERERCYQVRALRGTGVLRAESELSAPICGIPFDTEPPLAPTRLTSLAAEGAISLIWEPNGEQDLGGYVVLRSEPGSDTLLPLTAAPIRETRFTDDRVKAGVRYTYYVRAVDTRIPLPNVSDMAQVVETAR